jgi:hypothetical protein
MVLKRGFGLVFIYNSLLFLEHSPWCPSPLSLNSYFPPSCLRLLKTLPSFLVSASEAADVSETKVVMNVKLVSPGLAPQFLATLVGLW